MRSFHRVKKSQIAVIVTFVIVLLIVASMMLVNVGQLGSAKTQVSMASDKAALGLASQLSVHTNTLYEAIEYYKKGYWVDPFTGCGIDFGATIAFLFDAARQLFPYYFANPVTWTWKLGTMLATRFSADMDVMQYTLYDGFRENAIYSMLSSLNRDTAKVRRAPNSDYIFVDDDGVQYDLTGTVLGADLKKKNSRYVDRFSAWYHSKRVKQVSDEALRPEIEKYIKFVVDNTFIEKWDPQDWLIKDLSLKVSPVTVTRIGPQWVIDMSTVKIVGRCTAPAGDLFQAIWQSKDDFIGWLIGTPTYPLGFLKEKFISLTERLIDDGYSQADGGPITYVKKGWSILGVNYDTSEISRVITDISGYIMRSMELLNLSRSERIIQLPNWQPLLYDLSPGVTHPAEDGHDMYNRLYHDQLLVEKWIAELTQVNDDPADGISKRIPPPNGDYYTALGDGIHQCGNLHTCCCPCDGGDCPCDCCCPDLNVDPCSYEGIYCSAWPGKPPVCRNGDLYGTIPTAWCNLMDKSPPDCSCVSCPYEPQTPKFCKYQGMLTSSDHNGLTEVGQAREILMAFDSLLTEVQHKIKDMADSVKAMLVPANPNSLLQQMRREGIYGWKDKNGALHVIRAKVEGYPPYFGPNCFPYLKQEDGLGVLGFEKCWSVTGQTAGELAITASRYDSDIRSGWWSFRYRANPLQPEFDKATLAGIIAQVQMPSAGPVKPASGDYGLNPNEWPAAVDAASAELMNVSITSKTNAHYGRKKTEIYIQKLQ